MLLNRKSELSKNIAYQGFGSIMVLFLQGSQNLAIIITLPAIEPLSLNTAVIFLLPSTTMLTVLLLPDKSPPNDRNTIR